MAHFRLVLVRHGFSSGNQRQALAGWTDVPLTDEGRSALRALRASKPYPKTDRYYSSDLCRCTETFDILYGDDAVLTALLPGFREICFGSLEDKTPGEVDFREFFRRWLAGEPIADGESYQAFSSRVLYSLRELCSHCLRENVSSATVVTHSGVIRAILIGLGGLSPDRWFTFSSPNGLGYILDLDCGGFEPRLLDFSPIDAMDQSAGAALRVAGGYQFDRMIRADL